MSALADALTALLRDARRIAVSDTAEVTTVTRAGVVTVRVTDEGRAVLTATLDTRPRAEHPRAEQLELLERRPSSDPPTSPSEDEKPLAQDLATRTELHPPAVRHEVLDLHVESSNDAAKRLGVRRKWTVIVRRVGQPYERHSAHASESEANATATTVHGFGVCSVVTVTPSRSEKSSSGNAHHAYAVEGAWTVVASTDHHGWHRWVCADEATAWRVRVGEADAVAGLVVACVFGPDGSTARRGELHCEPEPVDAAPARIRGLAIGDQITLDDEPVEVLGVDDGGWVWCTVATDRGRPVDEGDCYWHEVTETSPGRWEVRPVDTEAPSAKATRARAEAKATTKAAPKATTKAKIPVEPEADALHAHGEQLIAWQQTEGGPWEVLLSRVSGPESALRETWTLAAQGFRARQYDRRGRCVLDSLSGGTR